MFRPVSTVPDYPSPVVETEEENGDKPEVEETEIEVLLTFKSEYIFGYDKGRAYTTCVAKLEDENFGKKYVTQLCDVYQVFQVWENDPNETLEKMRAFVHNCGGCIYCECLDIEANSLMRSPYDILNVWTSKDAFD